MIIGKPLQWPQKTTHLPNQTSSFPRKGKKEREKGKERVPFLRDGCCSEDKGFTAGTERSGKAEREREREREREGEKGALNGALALWRVKGSFLIHI